MKGTQITYKMQVEKDKFISKHKIKKSTADAIENVKLEGDRTIVSIPRARGDNGTDDNVEALEKKVRSKGKGDKAFSYKRQRT